VDQGDLDRAMELLKQQETICRELGNKSGIARSLGLRSEILMIQRQNYEAVVPLVEEAYRHAQASGEKDLMDDLYSRLEDIRNKVQEI